MGQRVLARQRQQRDSVQRLRTERNDMTGFESKRKMAKAKLDEDDDTQVYADTLLIVYQRGFADGKKAAERKPLTDEQVNECGMCGYVGKDKDKTGQCPNCRWDELRPLTGKAHQKPLTDDQIYEMYNEPRSDAEMLEFARALEAAHGIGEKK
jgi:predicted Zn-ribbon and HTH transcriptional regulator